MDHPEGVCPDAFLLYFQPLEGDGRGTLPDA